MVSPHLSGVWSLAMTITLYDIHLSPHARKVRLLAAELNIPLNKVTRDPRTGEMVKVDLKLVGEPAQINVMVLEQLRRADVIPVVAPIGFGVNDELTYNINADTSAGAIAGAMKAKRLLFLTDVPGVLDKNGNVIPDMTVEQARALIGDGSISGGMIPKVENCIDAVNRGVEAAVIMDGRVPHSLLLEVFTEAGVGTMVKRA